MIDKMNYVLMESYEQESILLAILQQWKKKATAETPI